ncbi:sensor histidine kinase [Aliarcobacter vitoriensis]|uniref:Histidine kinase domain-containing protein n=1 Tax=Aliarcobacter vitoriensis TaxID=2011099 RepID=A0A366MTM2_9BACT|nr:sensor histidine kinase [Aliarcobacter vitoriensis]RBQ29407.1 hypothetical protein CRU91_04805 [Aliarcobacter vitoriensis]
MKFFILILIFINTMFANPMFDVYIVEDDGFTFENIKFVKDFDKSSPNIKFDSSSNYWLKIKLNGNNFENKYVLTLYSKLFINPVEFENNNFFIESNVIEIKDNKDIYVKVFTPINEVDLTISLLQKDSYLKDNIIRKELYGISYGIIFATFLYYFALYIFNKEKSFIYYSITQVFIFLLIYFSFKDYSFSYLIYQFLIFGFLIFSNLFTKEFLNTKKYAPFLNKILTFLMYIFLFELVLYFFDISISFSWFLLIYLISAIVIYKKNKAKSTIFYIISWSIVIFTYIFVDFQSYFFNKTINPIFTIDLIHFIIPLESLILAFALSYKIKLSEDDKKRKQSLLIHQNRLSSMGEMVSNITHQWRQPLTHLGYLFMNIHTAFKHNKLNKKYMEDKISEANNQISYMSETLKDFRDFYSIKKEKSDFGALKSIQKALNICSSSLSLYEIDVVVNGDDFYICGYENEFSQVILNIISNAIDALNKNSVENPKISIELNKNIICIFDNAKGIYDIQDKIFEPYFTTKVSGSGIGLYMSKTIIEDSFNGKLYHKNVDDGSMFCIDLNFY